jgi:hypothetical protein
MERWWNDTDRWKTEVLGEKPLPVPFFPLQISNVLARKSNPGLSYEAGN